MPPSSTLYRLPVHVAIIMDGNGRWAKKRGMPRIMGHRQGVKVVREIVTAAREYGIRVLTLYAFSRENWQRPRDEVNALMDLLYEYLDNELQEMLRNNIVLFTIGETELLPRKVRDRLEETREQTRKNSGMVLNLALSYGGRSELVRACRKIAGACKNGTIDPSDIDETLLAGNLDTAGLPDPDLVIRTSGEQRISNFLLFQSAYSEFYFTSTLWPDFHRPEFDKALEDYQSRERRFGRTSEQVNI